MILWGRANQVVLTNSSTFRLGKGAKTWLHGSHDKEDSRGVHL